MKSYVYCENHNCDYETKIMDYKDLIYQISIDGGCIYSDKDGGYYSICPKCEKDSLIFYD